MGTMSAMACVILRSQSWKEQLPWHISEFSSDLETNREMILCKAVRAYFPVKIFASFLRVLDLLGTKFKKRKNCQALPGPVRMRSDVFKCIRRLLNISENSSENLVFWNLGEVFEELRKKGRHYQVPRHVSLRIHLMSGPKT